MQTLVANQPMTELSDLALIQNPAAQAKRSHDSNDSSPEEENLDTSAYL